MTVKDVTLDITDSGTVALLTLAAVTWSQCGIIGIIGTLVTCLFIGANIAKSLSEEPVKSVRRVDPMRPALKASIGKVYESFKVAKAAQEARLARHIQ